MPLQPLFTRGSHGGRAADGQNWNRLPSPSVSSSLYKACSLLSEPLFGPFLACAAALPQLPHVFEYLRLSIKSSLPAARRSAWCSLQRAPPRPPWPPGRCRLRPCTWASPSPPPRSTSSLPSSQTSSSWLWSPYCVLLVLKSLSQHHRKTETLFAFQSCLVLSKERRTRHAPGAKVGALLTKLVWAAEWCTYRRTGTHVDARTSAQ